MDIDEHMKLFLQKEELHPDLKDHLCDVSGTTMLKHPMYYQIFYTPQLNAVINKGYLFKKEYVEKKMKEKDYSAALLMYERPYRIEKLFEFKDEMTDDKYWETLGLVWTDSENLWQYREILSALLSDTRPGREKMMSEEEREFLANLPDSFVIYRGHQGKNKKGHSWTLSLAKAEWFANRFSPKTKGVLKAIANKKDVIAYLSGRGESEIVINPKKLKYVEVEPVKRSKELQKILDDAYEGFALKSNRYTDHGLKHWEKVEANGIALASNVPGADLLVVRLFAYLHDSKRENEDHDPEHGVRAANSLFDIGLKISSEQMKLLDFACRYHNDGETSDDPTIGVCWDADRLDLPRVGITPKSELLSTEAAKEMIWKI